MKRPKSILGQQSSFDFKHSFMLQFNLMSSVLAVSVLYYTQLVYAADSKELTPNQDWYITFSTGRRMWAGTDSDIYVELIGESDKSDVIHLIPAKDQMEAKSVDTFSLGNLQGRNIGKLETLIIAKQYTVGFFSDWELVQASVIDPFGKRYDFKCNCWLTNQRNKRTIKVTSSHDDPEPLIPPRAARVFPITIVLLSLFLIMILFSYFGNVLCKKWRENVQFLNDLRHGRTSLRRGSITNSNFGRTNGSILNRTDEYENRNRRSNYHNQDHLSLSIPLQVTSIEDKPPDYKELFPLDQVNQIEFASRQKTEEAIVVPQEMPNSPLFRSSSRQSATQPASDNIDSTNNNNNSINTNNQVENGTTNLTSV